MGRLVRAAGARRGGGALPRVPAALPGALGGDPRRLPCPAPHGGSARGYGLSRFLAGMPDLGPQGRVPCSLREGGPGPARHRRSRAKRRFAAPLGAPFSGVARPGLSPALLTSFAASLHRERAGAILPSCEESESPFPAASRRPAVGSAPHRSRPGSGHRRREPPSTVAPYPRGRLQARSRSSSAGSFCARFVRVW